MVSRGLKPTDRGEHTIRRRGATVERSNRTVAFKRRSATRDQKTSFVRGLKSTATIMASLRETAELGSSANPQPGKAALRSERFPAYRFLLCSAQPPAG